MIEETSIWNNGFQKQVGAHYLSSSAYVCGQTKAQVGSNSVGQNELNKLSAANVRDYVQQKIAVCQPDKVHICDGSDAEYRNLINLMVEQGMMKKLEKYENCWLTRTDPKDVARVESRTFISTKERRETIPITKDGVKGTLGYWMSPDEMEKALNERFPGCMRGRTMYVIPFSMGPVGSPLSKIGIEITDSPYVVASMRVMTRIGNAVLKQLGDADFVKCLHSVGAPLLAAQSDKKPAATFNWPCNPEKTIIAHIPDRNEIASFGSGYGGNSLLGKKCFALRLGSILAKREGWLAEHMLILGITNPRGQKKYIVAAFPSACGKTNLAMMNPSLPGYKIECVGDDIAWMRFNERGELRAINPEAGFFGVAPGTSEKTNPNAMKTILRNTIFTNVAETSDGDFYWEGLENKLRDNPELRIQSWLDEPWTPNSGKPAAHPNSRFCTPAEQCPVIDPAWEDPEGVPISAIIFGGRRPVGVPLVYESLNWKHGVFMGASMRSESTAAAEHTGKVVMHDPFAMRPFFGYNFGHYLNHWLSFAEKPNLQLPKIFHVNWFRKSATGDFLWPGFGENSRVLEWILRRVNNEDVAEITPIGYLPKADALNLDGLSEPVNVKELFDLPKDFWLNECEQIKKYFDEQVGDDLPEEINRQLAALKERFLKVN